MSMRGLARSAGAQITQGRTHELALPAADNPGKGYPSPSGRSMGATGLLTWVIAGNRGARTFYERRGGEIVAEQPFRWDGMNLVEAGYCWRDLDALAACCDSAAN